MSNLLTQEQNSQVKQLKEIVDSKLTAEDKKQLLEARVQDVLKLFGEKGTDLQPLELVLTKYYDVPVKREVFVIDYLLTPMVLKVIDWPAYFDKFEEKFHHQDFTFARRHLAIEQQYDPISLLSICLKGKVEKYVLDIQSNLDMLLKVQTQTRLSKLIDDLDHADKESKAYKAVEEKAKKQAYEDILNMIEILAVDFNKQPRDIQSEFAIQLVEIEGYDYSHVFDVFSRCNGFSQKATGEFDVVASDKDLPVATRYALCRHKEFEPKIRFQIEPSVVCD